MARPPNSLRSAFQSQLLQSRTIDSRAASTAIFTCVPAENSALFQPETVKRMNGATRSTLEGQAVWDIALVAFTDFQGAVIHGCAPVVQFLGCVSKAVGRLETATGTAPTISCKQVFYSPDLPTITFPDFRHKKKPQCFRVAVCPPRLTSKPVRSPRQRTPRFPS